MYQDFQKQDRKKRRRDIMNKLKYTHYDIVFQEVPNEVSLVFNISGCPHKCEGCHSKYLWNDVGNYISNDIDDIINKYKDMITCVCFMGGDQNTQELFALLFGVKHFHNLKTCVYSGCDDINKFNDAMSEIDYLKIGRYIEELGGLDSVNTNQKFYKIKNGELKDITSVFQK